MTSHRKKFMSSISLISDECYCFVRQYELVENTNMGTNY